MNFYFYSRKETNLGFDIEIWNTVNVLLQIELAETHLENRAILEQSFHKFLLKILNNLDLPGMPSHTDLIFY